MPPFRQRLPSTQLHHYPRMGPCSTIPCTGGHGHGHGQPSAVIVTTHKAQLTLPSLFWAKGSMPRPDRRLHETRRS
ncbi:hypothetical protein GQ44DRAFT_709854 [Phaeosphaeriaceae sp. PMI808]|nr:hypothetical protein GQ44DRAFT_709854 [Phaeosphaeriaceae sp. PMI808]